MFFSRPADKDMNPVVHMENGIQRLVSDNATKDFLAYMT